MEGEDHVHGIDGISLVDADSGETVVFHQGSWLAVIAAIIVKYAHKRPDEAVALTAQPVASYAAAVLLSHELEFHGALVIAHGEMYWHRGISPALPPGYRNWEENYRREHRLAAESFVWS